MADKYAYRASPELAGALRDWHQRFDTFRHEVVAPFPDKHGVDTTWRMDWETDLECIGFELLPGAVEVPKGLSASQKRAWLIPRGKAGDPWRERLTALNAGPKRGPILHLFDVDPVIEVLEDARWYRVGLHDTPDGYFLVWAHEHPHPGDHLIPVPLSVFYAAKERAEASTPPVVVT